MKNIPSSNVLDVEISGETHQIKFERDVRSLKINGREYRSSRSETNQFRLGLVCGFVACMLSILGWAYLTNYRTYDLDNHSIISKEAWFDLQNKNVKWDKTAGQFKLPTELPTELPTVNTSVNTAQID